LFNKAFRRKKGLKRSYKKGFFKETFYLTRMYSC
jgi:hypothetical protein